MTNHDGNSSGHASIEDAEDALLDRALATVPGMLTKPELVLLRRLAAASPATIVNLGTFAGLSTIALCLGARESHQDVITVDSFAWSLADSPLTDDDSVEAVRQTMLAVGASPRTVDTMLSLNEEKVRANLASFGLAPRIVRALSWEAADLVPERIGLCFVDADHTRESVEQDLAAWSPKMTESGVIVMHDYHFSDWPEVKLVADEWAARSGWTRAESAHQAQVFRRAVRG